ncbi:MAG: hypothetical protein QGH07_06805, partial [Alphaproteobacteria bacterium]|nr:hypothetical protein [Alphaproteobacteria bacterium]
GSIAEAGDGTKLFTRLQEAIGSVPRGQLAGAIVLSDGQIHDIPELLRPEVLAAPVHVRLAGQSDMRDRRLIIKNAPAYGIVGSTVSFTVRVEETDANLGIPAQLTVRKDGRQISQRNVAVGRDTTISVDIDHGGKSVIEFLVDHGPDELTIENNRAVLSVNGVRDRLLSCSFRASRTPENVRGGICSSPIRPWIWCTSQFSGLPRNKTAHRSTSFR